MTTFKGIDEETKKRDVMYEKNLDDGYGFWNSYTVKPEMDRAVDNLRKWGSKVRVLHYPNGVYVVMQKEGYRK